MFLLPRAEFTILTDSTPDEVRWRLFQQLAPETDTRRAARSKRFEGRVTGNHFELERIKVGGLDLFPPTISGEIKPQGAGAVVHVKVEEDPLSRTITIIWFGIIVIITAGFTFLALQAQQFGVILCPASFLVIQYGLFMLSFKLEVGMVQQFLEDLVVSGAQRPTTTVLTGEATPRQWYGGSQGAQRYGESARPPGQGEAPTGDYDTQKFPPSAKS